MPEETVIFPDIGLQLGVINALIMRQILKKEAVIEYLKPITGKLHKEIDVNYSYKAEKKRIEAALALLANFPLKLSAVQRIKTLDFYGNNPVYMLIEEALNVDTGGEADYYRVHSLDGIEQLTSLQRFDKGSYSDEADVTALLKHPNQFVEKPGRAEPDTEFHAQNVPKSSPSNLT